MGRERLIKDEFRYLLFTELYHRLESPRAQKRAFLLLESAIHCISKKGFDGLTFESVARDAGVARSLVKHYFNDRDELRLFAIKYIRLMFQKMAVDAMEKEHLPSVMLERYVHVCFQWVDKFRTHSLAWFFFLNHCSGNPRYREINTAAVEVGEDRIRSLLEQGKHSGCFRHRDSIKSAKVIQALLTGGMIVYASQDFAEPKSFVKVIQDHITELVLIRDVESGDRLP